MKIIKSKHTLPALLALVLLSSSAFGQPKMMPAEGMERYNHPGDKDRNPTPMIPDLTEQQREQIDKLHTEHLKTVMPLENELAEKMTRLRTLSTSEKVDMKKIDKMIEEIGAIKIQMMKDHAALHQKIRSLLTESQRLLFDSHHHPRAHGHGMGMP